MSCDTTSIYIDPLMVLGGIIDITTMAGTGTGSTLVNDGLGNALVTKDLIAGTGVTFTVTATDITINATAADLQSAYDASTSPEIIVDAVRGALTIRDNAVPIGANLFEVLNSASAPRFTVDVSGATVQGKLTVTGLIDPTGLVLDASLGGVPGGVPGVGNGTLWVDNATQELRYTNNFWTHDLYEETLGPTTDTISLIDGAPTGTVAMALSLVYCRNGNTVTMHNRTDNQLTGSTNANSRFWASSGSILSRFRPTTSDIIAVPIAVYNGGTLTSGTFGITTTGQFTIALGYTNGARTAGSPLFPASTTNHGVSQFTVAWNTDA